MKPSTSSDFAEQRFDYSTPGTTSPELIVMVGVSGSGKSTAAKSWVNWGRGEIVRLNRDILRSMMYEDVPWTAHKDEVIRAVERDMARTALKKGKSVIIDDTNCVRRTRAMWEELAREVRCRLRIVTMTTPLETCIERDAARQGKQCVGKDVILRQLGDLNKFKMATETQTEVLTRPVFEKAALLNGGWSVRLPGAKWVLVDVDGTLANCDGVRNPFDEARVLHDNPHPVVVEWVRALYPFYNVCIMSGRKEKCGDDTCDWMELQGVPFDHILMRHTKDNRKDAIVKKELLDMLLGVLKPEDIAFILDDRPQVIRMWRGESEVPEARHNYGRFTVYPVRGAVEEF